MTRLMLAGYSWSGRERKCCYLNLDGAQFADISAVSGFDFADDGRALAVTDWDGDGDQDVWLKCRTGPQLRFLRNDTRRPISLAMAPMSRYIAFRLTGRHANRDAIGARVEVTAGGRTITRELTAGDGYLSQSSKRLHFGLGNVERVERVVVRWPGSPTTQQFTGLDIDREYLLQQDDPRPLFAPIRNPPPELPQPAPGPALDNPPLSFARIVLRSALPLPPALLQEVGAAPGRATLVCFWAGWCQPCLDELAGLASGNEALASARLDVLGLNVDRPADRDKSQARLLARSPAIQAHVRLANASETAIPTFDAIVHNIRDYGGLASLPASLLIDARGSVAVLYLGAAPTTQLKLDAQLFGDGTIPDPRRVATTGRWYFGIARNYVTLAATLLDRGLTDAARFFGRLAVATGQYTPRTGPRPPR
ncbi:MAG: ASPIC/UnbV domain-containing protein [Phycisphaerae bacterium]